MEPEDGSLSYADEFGDKTIEDPTRDAEFLPQGRTSGTLTEYRERERQYKKMCIEAQEKATELFEELVVKYGQELV